DSDRHLCIVQIKPGHHGLISLLVRTVFVDRKNDIVQFQPGPLRGRTGRDVHDYRLFISPVFIFTDLESETQATCYRRASRQRLSRQREEDKKNSQNSLHSVNMIDKRTK